MKSKFILWVALALSVCAIVGYSHYLFDVKLPAKVEERMSAIIPDTILIHDTLRIVEPAPTEETEVGADTVWMERIVKDSIRDTVYVRVPITERTYEDSTYKAVVRGYNPELVSLDMYLKEVYFPKIVERKMKPRVVISAGVYGGFGVKGADYGLGISVGVPIWSW